MGPITNVISGLPFAIVTFSKALSVGFLGTASNLTELWPHKISPYNGEQHLHSPPKLPNLSSTDHPLSFFLIPLSTEEDQSYRRMRVSDFALTQLQLFWHMHRHKKIKLVLFLTLSFINIECSIFDHRTMLFLTFLFEVLFNIFKFTKNQEGKGEWLIFFF